MMRLGLAILAATFALSACAGPKVVRDVAPRADQGRLLAQRACAGCHGISPTARSPDKRAPNFDDIRVGYAQGDLRAALASISANGHVQMPPIYMTPDEIELLAAYIEGLGPGVGPVGAKVRLDQSAWSAGPVSLLQ